MIMADNPKIAVVMIVRDEVGRVGRALSSVRDVVDTWLVIDTGSSDSTLDEVQAATAGWPGEILERPWINFGENRTELLNTARHMRLAEWLLTVDADHVLVDAERLRPVVNHAHRKGVDAVLIPFTDTPLVWTPRLIRTDRPWCYVGATREYLDCDESFSVKKVDAPRIEDLADGASRANKWRRDVEMLREELAKEPDHSRSWFCLGESYRGLDQFELAAIAYTNCAVKSAKEEERYLALTLSGEMLLAQGDTEGGLTRLLLANQERPQRREALMMACQVLNKLGRHQEVTELLSNGSVHRPIPPSDVAGIVPGAYGSLMTREFVTATSLDRNTKGTKGPQ